MRASVRTTAEADQQALIAELWWARNRPSLANTFNDEFSAALDRLRWFPKLGRQYRVRGLRGVRRLYLTRTRHHVYYVYDEGAEEVVILSVWSALRGRRPRFRGR